MASMSRNNSSHALLGFSICQPTLGAPLQFFPVLGSKQLDDMIDIYVPGTISIQEKRAIVSMEFFEYSQQTGEMLKFYQVYQSTSSTSASPASSYTMQDSSSSSSFNVSPIMSELQWNDTPVSSTAKTSPSQSQSAPGKSSLDFAHIPGMKIMTKDGLDVTNSASRGCKTKEQRDHAHLMRIIKACPSCRRKKTRCDPSHKKRVASQAQSPPQAKATKKNKKHASASTCQNSVPENQPLFDAASFYGGIEGSTLTVNDDISSAQEPWEQFVQYDQETSSSVPFDYDFFFDPAGHFSPSGSNSSSVSPSQPFTPRLSSDAGFLENVAVPSVVAPEQTLLPPYLNIGTSEAGTAYVDFNLFSPESSWLDEDPSFSKTIAASPGLLTQVNSSPQPFQQDSNDATYLDRTAIIDTSQSNSSLSPILRRPRSVTLKTGGAQEARGSIGFHTIAEDPGSVFYQPRLLSQYTSVSARHEVGVLSSPSERETQVDVFCDTQSGLGLGLDQPSYTSVPAPPVVSPQRLATVTTTAREALTPSEARIVLAGSGPHTNPAPIIVTGGSAGDHARDEISSLRMAAVQRLSPTAEADRRSTDAAIYNGEIRCQSGVRDLLPPESSRVATHPELATACCAAPALLQPALLQSGDVNGLTNPSTAALSRSVGTGRLDHAPSQRNIHRKGNSFAPWAILSSLYLTVVFVYFLSSIIQPALTARWILGSNGYSETLSWVVYAALPRGAAYLSWLCWLESAIGSTSHAVNKDLLAKLAYDQQSSVHERPNTVQFLRCVADRVLRGKKRQSLRERSGDTATSLHASASVMFTV